jgi:hypothetical protein
MSFKPSLFNFGINIKRPVEKSTGLMLLFGNQKAQHLSTGRFAVNRVPNDANVILF